MTKSLTTDCRTDANCRRSHLLKPPLELRWRLLDEVTLNLNFKHTHISAVPIGYSRFRSQNREIFSYEEIISRREQLKLVPSMHANLRIFLGSLPHSLLSNAFDKRPGMPKFEVHRSESAQAFDGGNMSHKNVLSGCRQIRIECMAKLFRKGCTSTASTHRQDSGGT